MKFKPVYAYLSLAVILIVFVIIATQNKDSEKSLNEIANLEVPDDEVHKGLSDGQSPGKSNVSKDVWEKMEKMKKDVEANPDDTLKLREYADFLTQAHKPDEALQYYEEILKKDSNRTDILFSISFIYFNQKNFGKAENITKRILSLDKSNLLAKYNLGAIAAAQGDNEEAKKIWNEIIKEHPGTEASRIAEQSISNLNI